MRGQGYDGAAAMSVRLHGVQAYVREVVPTAIYVHYAARSLNLVISRLCSVQAVRNCIGIIGAVSNFSTLQRDKLYLKELSKIHAKQPK